MTKPSTYIIGIIVFTLLLVSSVTIITQAFRDSPETLTNSERFITFNATFNKMDDVTENVDNLEDNIITSTPDVGLFGILNGLIQAAWNTLKLITQSFGFMASAMVGLTSIWGVPSFVVSLLVAIITIIIIFAIYSAIFQRDV